MSNIDQEYDMEEKYDFTNAEQGKFYNPKAVFIHPIYLEEDVDDYISKLAEKMNIDIQSLVNNWLRSNIQLIESVQ